MAQYYFISTALPTIAIGVKPEISTKELKEILSLNLTLEDRKKVQDLLRPIDLANMRALWLGLPLDDRGNLSSKELEEALLVREGLPGFVLDFLDRYETTEERLWHFPALYAALYNEKKSEGILQKIYDLEREMRLVLTALRAKKMGRDLVRELQFEDPTDPFVMEILAQKDAADYFPPQEYEELKQKFQQYSADPKALHRAILEYKFKKIEEMEENEHFSLDHILGFLARLLLVEDWDHQNEEKGRAVVDELSGSDE